MRKRIILGSLFVLVTSLAVAACSARCSEGAICGDFNTISPNTITTTTTTTTTTNATPTPDPGGLSPACVAQTAPFTCQKTPFPAFGTILANVQGGVAAAPEPIYIANLVRALNANAELCAVAGPSPDEVTIKARISNAQSETWDVVRADGQPQALLVQTCNPARF